MKVAIFVCLLAALSAPALAKRRLAQAPTSGVTDTDILNYALNLEYLEAEFYSCAATGSPIPDELRGGGPASTGCEKAQLSDAAQDYATELANDETNHVRVIREALGGDAAPIPQLDIGSAFAAAADAAFGTTLSPAFTPYANDLFFYHGSFIFEDVGVSAYLGGAGLIQDTSILETAAKILAVEGYHAGAIRTLLYQQRDTVTPYNVTVAEITQSIADLRAQVGGGLDQGVEDTDGEGSNIVATDENGLVSARTPAQVIDIVTLGAGPSGGGFFPNGLNNVDALLGASSS